MWNPIDTVKDVAEGVGDVLGAGVGVGTTAASYAAPIATGVAQSSMPWYVQTGIGIANNFLGGAAGAAGQNLGSQMFAPEPAEVDPEQLRLGYNEERRSWRKMQRFEWQQAQKRGLTAQEFYGSPVPGGSPGGSGAQTLGNAASQGEIAAQGRAAAAYNAGADRAVALSQQQTQKDVAMINAEAQMYSADRAAGVQTRGQDIQKEIADRTFSLDEKRLEAELKQRAMDLKISYQELRHKINQVATSTPEFLTAMKQLSMGPANLLTELTLRHHNISLSDDNFNNLSETERKRIIDEIVALGANSYVEWQGVETVGVNALKEANKILNDILRVLKIPFSGGITQTPNNGQSLGNPSPEAAYP